MALIAQLGEHCTSIAEVVGSNPAQSLKFFSGICSSSVTAALALMTVITFFCDGIKTKNACKAFRSTVSLYSLSHKTVNAKENFWNVYCFAANQTRDETAKDNRQTAAGISHDLIRNNELAVFLLQEIFNIPVGSLWKGYFLTTNQHQSLDSVCSKT